MAGDVCFLADYRYGGYLATSYFACMGIKDVFFVHLDYDSYYIKLQNEGFTTAVAENGLNNLGSLIIKRDSCEKIKNELNQLPAGVGIVANSRKAAKYALEHMNTCGKELGKDFHIFACEGGDIPAIELPENIPYLDFPSGKILWEAVDYLLNDHIPADFIFHKYFKPEVINPDPQVLNKLKTKLNK
jgi:DNA-binding LacI/PurR family transcriptional regulator